MTVSITRGQCDTQHNNTRLSLVDVGCPYAECPYAECPYAECPYAECPKPKER